MREMWGLKGRGGKRRKIKEGIGTERVVVEIGGWWVRIGD